MYLFIFSFFKPLESLREYFCRDEMEILHIYQFLEGLNFEECDERLKPKTLPRLKTHVTSFYIVL